MRRTATVALILIAALLFVAVARGGGSWLIRKVRVMHGVH
jgi:hypothetical protein